VDKQCRFLTCSALTALTASVNFEAAAAAEPSLARVQAALQSGQQHPASVLSPHAMAAQSAHTQVWPQGSRVILASATPQVRQRRGP